MIRPRVIPVLLLQNRGLVKTRKFKDPTYLGDPINIVRIFNDKEVDELIFLDITATAQNRSPSFVLLKDITSECFMPLGYGGGIRSIDDVRRLMGIGIEKVILNASAVENPTLVRSAADYVGSSSVVVSMDVKKGLQGKYEILTRNGKNRTGLDPVKHAVEMEKMGAGELFVNSVDRDGTMQGYDGDLIKSISSAVSIPIVAFGGGGEIQGFVGGIQNGRGSAAGPRGRLWL